MFYQSGEHLITSAYVFGTAGAIFAFFPFLFIVIRGIMRANDNTTQAGDILGVFLNAYVVHFLSCVFFMIMIKALDILSAVNGDKVFEEKIFGIFWAKSKDEVNSLAGISNPSVVADGAYVILYLVQTLLNYAILLTPLFVFFAAIAYGTFQARKEVYRQDTVTTICWLIFSVIIASFLYYSWSAIASLSLFIPNTNLPNLTSELWSEILLKNNTN